jgi:hypothetical protein
VGTKLLKNKIRQIDLKSLPAWCPSLFVYLFLVWGFALVRINYLWIAGDDPNLITQAALTRDGLKPNLDFESGYPGLSQFIQAGIMHVFGTNIFSQHLYTALLASLMGLLICINFSRLPQWLLSLGLVLIYCQQHLVNPTPNPGHLFELFLLSTFTLINRQVIRSKKFIFCSSFILLGVAFLSKQYAIFVLLGYAISQFENVNWKISDRKKYMLLMFTGVLAASSYYFLLIPNGTMKLQASASLFAMVLPFIVLICANYRSQSLKKTQSFANTARDITLGATVFLLTILVGLAVLYQSIRLPHVLYQVLIEAPRRINDNTVLLSFSLDSVKSIGAFIGFAICTVYLVVAQYSNQKNNFRVFVFHFLAILIGALTFTQIGNLSSTLALILFPIVVIYTYFKKIRVVPSNRRQFFYVLACYQFVLIPYPNINFHIMMFVVAFFILVTDSYGVLLTKKMAHLWAFPILLVILLLVHEVRTIDAMKTYSFQNVEFKSGSTSWELAITDAQNAKGDLSACSTLGCKMLILVSEK